MNNQESMHQILKSALNEIRAKYGLALYTINVEWRGTGDQPDRSVAELGLNGLSYLPIDRDGQ